MPDPNVEVTYPNQLVEWKARCHTLVVKGTASGVTGLTARLTRDGSTDSTYTKCYAEFRRTQSDLQWRIVFRGDLSPGKYTLGVTGYKGKEEVLTNPQAGRFTIIYPVTTHGLTPSPEAARDTPQAHSKVLTIDIIYPLCPATISVDEAGIFNPCGGLADHSLVSVSWGGDEADFKQDFGTFWTAQFSKSDPGTYQLVATDSNDHEARCVVTVQ